MEIPRIIQIYIVQGLIGLFYFYVAFKVLRRDVKNLHLILSGFYISVGIGVIINMIYASIFNTSIVYLLHFITYYLACYGQVFMLIFILILSKSEKIITIKIQLMLIVSFGILFFGLWFIPGGIQINETTNWLPVWSWEFLIYSYIICTFFTFIPTIYYSRSIYIKLENKKLKQKWMFFVVGLFSYYILYYGTSLSNTLNNPVSRLIWSIISLFLIPLSYLIYYGVGRQL
jgi:hypothetical protein